MAENVKFVEFEKVPNAPKLAVPADFSQEQINEYLKTEAVENAMFEKGFNFKYGLQPVDMLELENLDDGSFHSSWKSGWDSLKAIGSSSLAGFYDFVGAKENQEEALKAAEQYMLDQSAHIFRIDKEGKLLPRPNTIEDIMNSEEQMTAFTQYLKFTSGNAAATSIPTILAGIIGGVGGALVGGPPGAVAGSMGATALSGWIFGLGDTYLAQREAGVEDPNVYLSMALGVPYGAVEMIGIGGVVPAAVRVFGGPKEAAKAFQKGIVQQVKNGQKGNLRKIPGMYGRGILKTGLEEGLAEGIQETLNVTAGGIATGVNFDELFGNKDFAKQLGEAAAAGFFGGWGFGTINPTLRTIKMLGKGTGPVDMKGGAAISNLDSIEDSTPFFADKTFGIGDTVIVDNIMLPDIKNKETPLFGKKPKFNVVGTAEIDGLRQYILSQTDIPAAIATIPITQAGMINKVDPPKGGAAPGEEYVYDEMEDGETIPGTPDKNLSKEYSQSKEALKQTGFIPDAKDTTTDTFLGGKEKVINNVVNSIESERAAQKKQALKPEQAEEFKEKYGYDPMVTPLNPLYKKYDKFSGDTLKKEVTKDYTYWRDLALIDRSFTDAQENFVSKEDQERFQKLGYQSGPRGRAYIDKLVGNTTPTKNKKSTEGKQALDNIIKNNAPFSSLAPLYGGPVTEKIVVGEKEIVTTPLTAAQKASLTGDKLIPIMRYHSAMFKEELRFEDLHDIPANERMRMILQLADALDSTGVKRKYFEQWNEVREEIQNKINAARSQFGMLSDSYKEAKQELKDFNNTGEHIMRADHRMGDIKEAFRLWQILSPKAIRIAEKQIYTLKRDSRYHSKEHSIRAPLEAEVTAYENLIQSAYRSRKQLNQLLQSLSIEPILNWETMTLAKVKRQITKLRKQINQTETEVKKRPITAGVTWVETQEEGDAILDESQSLAQYIISIGKNKLKKNINYASQPSVLLEADENAPLIAETMRIVLDKLGLSKVDMAIIDKILLNMEGNASGAYSTSSLPELPYGLMQVAFDLDTYQSINDRLERDNYANPKLKKQDWALKNYMIAVAINTIHHEGIHALKALGLFTNKEWTMLEKEADNIWIKQYDIKTKYPAGNQKIWREEAIANAFGNYAMERRLPNDNIKTIFQRIKSFLIAFVNGLQGAGFHTPESIFNKIEAGLVATRMRVANETAEIYNSKNIDNMMMTNPRGTVVISHNFKDTNENRDIQHAWLEMTLGEKLIRKPVMDALRKAGYTAGVPEVISTVIVIDAAGNRRQGTREGPVVPPLTTIEGMQFEAKRLYKIFSEEHKESNIGPEENLLTEKTEENFNNYLVMQNKINRWAMDRRIVAGRVAIGQDTLYEMKFSTDPSKIRWTYKLTNLTGGAIGLASGITDIGNSLYTYMTPDQYLDLTMQLQNTEYDKNALKFMAQGVVDKKEFGMPYLIIEVKEDGKIGKVVGQEGRHRAATAKKINGPQSNMPVAVQIINERDDFKSGNITRNDKRKDPVNKKIISNFINDGLLTGMDREVFREDPTTDAGALDETRDPFNVRERMKFESSSISTKQIISAVYESFDQTPGGDLQFTNQYINYNGPNTSTEVGGNPYNDTKFEMNRQDLNQANKKIEELINKSSEAFAKPGGKATPDNMSTWQRIMGHARSVAKMNTPFTLLYNAIMDMTRKTRSLQQQFSRLLSQRYLQVIKDPAMRELLAKAMIIAQVNDTMEMKVDGQERLIFVAEKDGGSADLEVKKGDIIVLEGDVAKAFMDVHKTFQDVNKEFLKAEIARDHIPNLIMALNILRRYFPGMPELKTLFNFEGLSQPEISNRLEELDYTQIKFIKTNLENIMIMRTSMQGDVADQINRLLGNKDTGLNALLDIAGNIETLNRKMYVPLMRFGNYFISVHQTVVEEDKTGKEVEVDKLVWYQQFESMGEAQAAMNDIRLKFPDGEISKPAEMSIEKLREMIREGRGFRNLEYLAQFMADTNAQNYQEILKALRETLAKKGLDKDVLGINRFYIQRDKSVGAEGVPGYSSDFPRAIFQYLSVASGTIARNRYAKDKNKYYDETRKYALDKGNKNLLKFTENYYNYVEDPVQEFAFYRRIGFWWYLGGNLSSAFLQVMSMVQFTGPILSQLAGKGFQFKVTRELAKAFAHASGMVVHGVAGKNQYQDAFLDFERLPDGPIKEALMRAIADGTIKQGQALLEAGIMPGMGGDLVGSQQARHKAIRTFENVVVGGAFNTFEAASRITAFIATYNLAANDPSVLDKADLLYGNDMDYQYTMEQFGRSPEALARFMTDETFGVYGKENRQALGRGIGSLAALFMTYMTQMVGLMYRMLNPPVLKRKASGGFTVGLADPTKTAAQNKIGRKAFARIMLMMLVTGGVMGLPGGEDAEDTYDLIKKMFTGVDSDVRTEFRNMLYEAGWGPGLINAMENGLINSTLGWDIQRRVGFGVLPWSQQVRAGLNMMGIPTGAKAEEFLGAPGSVYIDAIRGLMERGVREQQWGEALEQTLPTAIRNVLKAVRYSPYGNGFASTGYGQVLTDDIKGYELIMQAFGFAPASIAKEREALFQERKLDKGMNLFRQRKNAQITNAYRDIIMGGMKYDASMINEGEQKIADIIIDVMEYNANQPPHLIYVPDLGSLFQEALKAVHPEYRIGATNKKLIGEKMQIRMALGLD